MFYTYLRNTGRHIRYRF